jgi:hypothetical protein
MLYIILIIMCSTQKTFYGLLKLFFFYSILKSHVWSSIEKKETNPSRSSDIQVLSNIKYSNSAKCTCIGLDLTISFRKTI